MTTAPEARDPELLKKLDAVADRALDTAMITAPEARDPELLQKLDALAGRVLKS